LTIALAAQHNASPPSAKPDFLHGNPAAVTDPTESGNPAEDARGFRRALSHFATGVTIITTAHGGQLAGVTANSFSSVSLDPPLVLWSLGKSSTSQALFRQAEYFAVNVLAAGQMELASHFARSSPDKFAGVAWHAGAGGAPLFPDTAAAFECRVHELIDAGDHYILIGRVERYARSERDLLLFAQGRFGLAVDYPPTPDAAAAANDASNVQTTMLGLLWDAFSGLSHGFQGERDAEGMSINQGRLLSLIERHPGAGVDQLARMAFISPQGVEESIVRLIGMAYAVARVDAGWQVTESGMERVESLRQRANAFEAAQLRNFSIAEIETTRKVLRALGLAQA